MALDSVAQGQHHLLSVLRSLALAAPSACAACALEPAAAPLLLAEASGFPRAPRLLCSRTALLLSVSPVTVPESLTRVHDDQAEMRAPHACRGLCLQWCIARVTDTVTGRT